MMEYLSASGTTDLVAWGFNPMKCKGI